MTNARSPALGDLLGSGAGHAEDFADLSPRSTFLRLHGGCALTFLPGAVSSSHCFWELAEGVAARLRVYGQDSPNFTAFSMTGCPFSFSPAAGFWLHTCQFDSTSTNRSSPLTSLTVMDVPLPSA